MRWPASVLDATELERLRSKGLLAVNSYIYESIIAAANSKGLRDQVSNIISRGLLDAPEVGVLNSGLSALGFAGAEQVAELVKEIALGA